MKKLAILVFLLVLVLTGCSLPDLNILGNQGEMEVIEPEEARNVARRFVNDYLVDPASPASIGEIKEVSGLYQMMVTMENGGQADLYMTKDGKYYFTQAIDAVKTREAAQSIQPAPATDQVSIEILEGGTGEVAVTATSTVTVDYQGWLADGTLFDSSIQRGEPMTVQLGQGGTIPGWEQGMIGMKVGEKRRIVIPPAFAYGAEGVEGVIPANATLTFEVELLSVE